MKKILLLQFRTDASAKQELESFQRIAASDGTFNVIPKNVFTDVLAWDDPEALLEPYDGVILGGSGQYHLHGHDTPEAERQLRSMLDRITPLLRHLIANDFPTLGVCLGHQILGHMQGVRTIHDTTQAKAGSHRLCRTPECADDPVFGSLPNDFYAQYGHFGSLECLPDGAILLANGEKCKYGAIRIKTNIYSVQFHPEMDLEDTKRKMALYPDYKKNDPNMEKNLRPSPHAEQVVRNFVHHARRRFGST